MDHDAVVSSGLGAIHTYAIMYEPRLPFFDLPHVIVVVDLEDPSVRFVSQMHPDHRDGVEIGMPVAVVFQELAPDYHLPVFVQRGVATGSEGGS